MDGIHDLGGKHGFGVPAVEPDEPTFHERWEASVFTMLRAARATGAIRNTDQFRHAIERIEPAAYLAHGYYGRWLGGIETLLLEAGVIDRAALDARVRALGGDPEALVAARADPLREPVAYPPEGPGNQRAVARPPRWSLQDRIRTGTHTVPGHTRLPAYARGRMGTIVALHGGWVYPDSNAHGRGEAPEHLYTVAFDGTELWGTEGEPHTRMHLDLFESYLETP